MARNDDHSAGSGDGQSVAERDSRGHIYNHGPYRSDDADYSRNFAQDSGGAQGSLHTNYNDDFMTGSGARNAWGAGYAGRGPKNYRRSDTRVHDEVCEALGRHPEIDASDIDVRVENGEVTLSGTVSDRRIKRMAEDVAERSSRVHDVHNQLRIARSGS